ncbi:hypothetical protein [Terriglobus saanensis]|uniref:Uncharacterized protein n=1 Tax=Terriglobus saanensis (strain ATCC BAA-1853 / DSM 23119 / SP1PR4) TaxID=401053 RepID=E8V3L7_TERSS|nr:hypothetical protein [Terriglobus saanensis]ADV84704.1 hypothetical protein AciPR4_3955 [Terriglobus saanensis SP1PR4]
MRKFLLFLFVTTVLPGVLLYHYRNRIYLWDMVSRVRVDGTRITSFYPRPSDVISARVYINAANDIYVERKGFSPDRLVLQKSMAAPADPGKEIRCWVKSFCFATADAVPVATPQYNAHAAMSSRVVEWMDAEHHSWKVQLY